MKENPYRQDNEELRELLKQFENLRTGRSHSFLDEESFERIVDYFDDKDELNKALEAVELGIEQYPYSSSLLVKKADLLIATRWPWISRKRPFPCSKKPLSSLKARIG